MQLSLPQQFELVKFDRIIDNAASLEQLRKISKQLLKAWFVQRAAVNFALQQKLTEFQKEAFPNSL
jgi:hypothetical protein